MIGDAPLMTFSKRSILFSLLVNILNQRGVKMKKIIFVDTETKGLYGKLLLGGVKKDGQFYFFDKEDEMKQFLTDMIEQGYVIVGHNLFYDFYILDFIPPNRDSFDDTYLFTKAYQVELKITEPNRGAFGLENLCEYFGLYKYKSDKNKIRKNLERGVATLNDDIKFYLIEDLNATELLYQRTIAQYNKFKPVYILDKAFLIRLLQIQQRGVPFDLEQARQRLQEITTIFNQNQSSFRRTYGFNPFSPSQVASKLKLPDAQKQTLLYTYFTTKDQKLKQCIQDILALKKQQDEVASLRDWVSRCKDGYIYGHFDVCGSITGRLSCNNPNLLNIPRHLKFLFYKKPFLKFDFSQIELRLAGQIYNIPTFIQAYQKKEDLHTKTASFLFDKPIEQITKEERHIAKQFNFALIYGASPRALQEILLEANITLTFDETSYLRTKWFSFHKKVKEHIDTIANSLKNGSIPVFTVLGRNRYTEHLNIALNFPIQGTGAELLKGTVVLFTKKYPNARIVNLIHDEIQIECETIEEAKEYADALIQCGKEMWYFFFKDPQIDFEGEFEIIS